MVNSDLYDWIEEHTRPGVVWYVKRLSASDTFAKGQRNAGVRMHRDFLFKIFPSIKRKEIKNPYNYFKLIVDPYNIVRKSRVVWYNNIFRGGKRDCVRLTNLGDASSPLLDPESTGSIAVFAFYQLDSDEDFSVCHVWVCQEESQSDIIESMFSFELEYRNYHVVWGFGQ